MLLWLIATFAGSYVLEHNTGNFSCYKCTANCRCPCAYAVNCIAVTLAIAIAYISH